MLRLRTVVARWWRGCRDPGSEPAAQPLMQRSREAAPGGRDADRACFPGMHRPCRPCGARSDGDSWLFLPAASDDGRSILDSPPPSPTSSAFLSPDWAGSDDAGFGSASEGPSASQSTTTTASPAPAPPASKRQRQAPAARISASEREQIGWHFAAGLRTLGPQCLRATDMAAPAGLQAIAALWLVLVERLRPSGEAFAQFPELWLLAGLILQARALDLKEAF